MLTITATSLSGGQGKSTVCYFLGRLLARRGKRVLMVDADPQSSLTFYLGHEVEDTQPTLLEVLQKEVVVKDGIYALQYKNLWAIPADDALDRVQAYLSQSGVMGATLLKRRLKEVKSLFDVCIVDSPPQRSHICVTAMCAADVLIIPAEASSKGVNSLLRTMELVSELEEEEAFTGETLGFIPFRDRWIGKTQANRSKRSIEAMSKTELSVLPSILESERYKQAVDQGVMLSEMGHSDLEYPFEKIIELIGQL